MLDEIKAGELKENDLFHFPDQLTVWKRSEDPNEATIWCDHRTGKQHGFTALRGNWPVVRLTLQEAQKLHATCKK